MKKLLSLFITLLLALKVYAGEITVYAAADLTYAMEEILKVYKQKYPQDNIKVIYGSSGKAYNQIVNGAPYDIFFSADLGFVEKLKQQGLTASDIRPYAVGRIVLWTRKDSGIDVSKGINVVLDPKVNKIAIA
ncbi:MAG: molybdate ABC transporter substrate-binding protein, partial [Sulfurihydrogenibium sp.]